MDTRIGLGPVYAFERLSGSRRWQTYAFRSLYAGMLLSALTYSWSTIRSDHPFVTIREYASVGTVLAYAILGTQIALMMLIAPAATAGAICIEKQRGTMTHLLVTDLSNAEIILGKLAARLQPVVSVSLSSLGIVAISALLGGIVPETVFAAFFISVGVAILGCSLALVFSVWGSRTHEVLLATYSVLGLWLLATPLAHGIGFRGRGGRWSAPEWIEWSDPFLLAFRPFWYQGSSNFWASVIFAVVTIAISSVLVTIAILRVRAVAANLKGPKRRKTVQLKRRRRLRDLLPGPTLDGNPVLWREWNRVGYSKRLLLSKVLYYSISAAFCGMVILEWIGRGKASPIFAAWVNAWITNVGLLILCVTASTALAEERVRGSLDVLMTTPLSTWEIVWGKWWGSAQSIAPLAIFPAIISFATSGFSDRPFAWLLIPIYVVTTGLVIVSLGLALATWQSKVSLAITFSVVSFLALTAGWLFMLIAGVHTPEREILGYFSPFFALAQGTFTMGSKNTRDYESLYWGMLIVPLTWTFVSGSLLLLTTLTFDRFLGRVSTTRWRFVGPKANPEPAIVS